MHADKCCGEKEFDREVTIGDGVDRVGRRRVKPSSRAVASGSSGSDEPARAPEPKGEIGRPLVPVAQPVDVAQQRMHVGQQQVPERHRLGVLHVGHARRGDVDVSAGLHRQRVGERDHLTGDRPGRIAQVQPKVGGHLVVAAAPGPQLAAQRAEPLEQAALERGVDVLVLDRRPESARRDVGFEAVERAEQLAQLVVGEQPRPREHPGVGPAARDVVRRQPPVELDADRELGQRLGG